MILALPIPASAEGPVIYEFAAQEVPVYDPETGEPTGTTTEYLRIPETQVLAHGDIEFKGQPRRIVTFHPAASDRQRVEACPEYEAPDWAVFRDKYLSEYRQLRMISAGEVDTEGNAVHEVLDDYITAGKNTELIKSGYMRGGAYLGIDDQT